MAKKKIAPKVSRAVAQPQPLIAVQDVVASTAWYSKLLDLEPLGNSDHADIYERLMSNGNLVLQLHLWDEEDHPNLTGPNDAAHGHGVLIWFQLDDFHGAVKRARALKADIVREPLVNANAHHDEI